jgi:hypothetical protein
MCGFWQCGMAFLPEQKSHCLLLQKFHMLDVGSLFHF